MVVGAMTDHIVLSRRNIESLLHMLDHRDKQRPAIVTSSGLTVEVQENDDYYDDPRASKRKAS